MTTEPVVKRDYISYSQLQMLMKCGVQYQFRYLLGLKIPPNGIMFRGTVGHEVNEINFRQKIETHMDLSVEEIVDLYATQWDAGLTRVVEAAEAGEEPTTEDRVIFSARDEKVLPAKAVGKSVKDYLKDTGIQMARQYREEVAPTVQPTHVEQEIIVNFESGHKLKAILDRIDADKDGVTPAIITDTKFPTKSPQADDIQNDLQMTTYDAAYRAEFGAPPEGLRKDYIVGLKTGVKIVTQTAAPRSADQIDRLMVRLDSGLQALEQGIFMPAPFGAWWCSEGFCGYWKLCKYRP